MTEAELLQTADARISEHRMAEAEIIVQSGDKALRTGQVTVEQSRHEFLFGANIFMLGRFGKTEENQSYLAQFSALLNYATLPFYWGAYEPEQGKPHFAQLEKMAAAAREAGIECKGHPLIWHEVPCKWWPNDSDEFEKIAEARVRREVSHFADLIHRWDVVNEAVVGPDHDNAEGRWLKKLGAAEGVARALKWARAASSARAAKDAGPPAAQLLVNDFELGPKYVKLLQEIREHGGEFNAIGLQSHMHPGTWPLTNAWEVCERFKGFGVPLHFTELTVLSGKLKTDNDWMGFHPGWNTTPDGELAQADYVEKFYTVVFSHPATAAITWWDFSDHGAWQGAPAGLVRADLTPKPAYDRLLKLVKGKWWTKLTTEPGARFRGFLGTYDVSVKLPDGRTAKGKFTLLRGQKNRWVITA